MKNNLLKSISLVILSVFLMNDLAGQTVTVGTGTSATGSYRRLFHGYYEDGTTQMYISASELSSMSTGNIESIAFNAAVASAIPFNNTQVLIQTYSSNPSGNISSGWTTCYTGTVNISTGWNTISFDTPFSYTAGNGLLVKVCYNNSTWTSSYPSFYYTSSSSSVKHASADGMDLCSYTGGLSNSSYRPNMRFVCAPPQSCGKPVTLTSSSVTASSATIGWSAPSSAPSSGYEYYYSTSSSAPTSGTTASGSVSAGTTSASISGLTASTTYYFWARSNCGSEYSDWSNSANFTTGCAVASLPYSEGFNSGSIPSCWSTAIVATQTASKLSYVTSGSYPTTSPQEGSHMVYYNSYFSTGGGSGSQERLMSGAINSSGSSNLLLDFYFNHDNSYNYSGEGIQPQYSVDGGTTWTDVGSLIVRYSTSLSGWTNYILTLPSGADNQADLRVGFKFVSAYGNNMYLDNVQVYAAPVPTITSFTPSSICEGSTVTITGTNFTGVTSLTIGGTAASSFTVNSATEIAAVVGSGTTGTISISNGSQSATSTSSLTVNSVPTAVTVSAGSICSGSSVNLTASGGSGGTIYWQGTNSGGTQDVTNSGSTSPAYTSAGTYYANAVSSAGCWGTEGSAAVSVFANPTNVTASSSAAGVCSGETVNLTGSFDDVPGTIGTSELSGTALNDFPFSTYWQDARSEFLYYASDLNAAGLTGAASITSIAFNVISNNSYSMNNFTIKMRHSSSTAISSFSAGMSTYYSATESVASTGWKTMTLDTPFSWNGTDNILIQICFDNTGYSGDSEVYWYGPSTTASSVVRSLVADGDNLTGCSIASPELSGYYLPQMRFTATQSDTYSWSSDVGGFTSSDQNPTSNTISENTSYTLTASTMAGCTATATAAVTYDQPAAISTTVDASSVSSGASFRLDQNIGWTSTNSSNIGYKWDADEASPFSNYSFVWTSPATWSDNAGSFLNGGDSRTLYLRSRNVNNVTCYSDAVTAVLRKPLVSTSGTLSSFTSCEGTAATEQSFTVTGQYLTNDLTVTAPTGFEVSASSGSGYASSITLTPTDGSVSATVYVQIPTTTSSGSPSGDITCSSVHNLNGSSTSASATVSATGTVTAAPNAGTLSGTEAVCSNATTDFDTDGDSGGSWSSADDNVATINSSSGLVTAVAAGSSVMTYTVSGSGGCSDATATITATVTTAPDAGTLSGTEAICTGGTTDFDTDGDSGGTWSSADDNVATINSSSGLVTAVSAGTSVMTYTVSGSGGCSDATATRTATVGVAPTITTTEDLTTVANTCGVTEISISHSGTGGNGEWTSSGGTVAFTSGSSTDASVSVRPISTDVNTDITMIWTIDGGEACDGSSISKVIRFNQPTAISNPDTYCYLWGGLTSTDITTGDNWYKWNATTGVDMWERQSSPPSASTDKLHVLTTDNSCIHATNTPIYASSVVANSLNVTSGTDITINSGTLNISGDIDVDGTVTIASGAVLDADGDFDATGGNVTFSGAGTLQVSNSTTSFGTLTTTVGTVKYDGSSAQTIVAGDYYNLDIDGSGTKSLAGNTTVNGDITLTDGELNFNGNKNLNVIGDITKTSGALVNSSSSNGYLVLKATSSQNASQALCGFTAPSVSIKVQQSADVEITGDISANYLWVQANNSGTFTIDNDYDLTVDNYIKIAGGTLNVVSGSLTTTFNSSTNHELSGGTLDIDGGTVSFGSPSNNTTDINMDGGTIDISGGTLNVSDCIDIVSGTFTQSGGVVNVKTNTDVNGDSDHKFKMAAGTLNLTGGTMNLLGESTATGKHSMSIDAGVTTTSTSSHTIAVITNDATGDEDRHIDMGDASNDIGNLTFDLAGHDLDFISNTDILGNLTATNGDINVSSLTVNVAGNAEFTNDDLNISTGILDVEGTFNSPNNTTFSDAGRLQLAGTVSSLGTMTSSVGTVEYDAAGAQDVLADTYFNLEVDGSGTKTLAAANITVNGDLSLTAGSLAYNGGSSSKLITLKGSVLGTGTLTASTTSIFKIGGNGTNQDIRGISSDNIGVRLSGSANATTSGDITAKYLDLLSGSTGTFTIDGETFTINPTGGYLEMDGGDLTVSSGSLIINSTSETTNELDAGTLTVSGGTVTFTGNSSSTNTGGDLNVDGGTLTVSSGSISINDELDIGSGTINQTGGAIYVDAGTNNSNGSNANKFDMATGSLNLSGGTIYAQSQSSSSYNCINIASGVSASIGSGHTFDIGTNSTAKNMYFNFGGNSIGNLTVNLPAKNAYFSEDLNIQGNVNIIDGTLVVDTHNPSVAGSTTVSGTLKVGAGSYDANGTFDASNGTIDFNNGNAQLYVSTPSVTSFGALDDATGTVVYDGTSAQTIDEAETFYSLKVDNSSGVTLNEAVGVNGTLNMTSGNIVNPSNILTVGSSAGAGSISHTSGIVTGKLRQYFANATGSKFFPIGNSTIMRDVTVDFTSAPGANQYLTASYNAGHPQANDGSDLYGGLPLVTDDGQLIQNYDDDGYWEIIPGSSSTGDSYSTSINAKAYNVSLHCNDLTGADNVTNMDRTKVRVIKSAGPGHTSWEALTHVSISGTDADFTLTGSGTGFSFFGAGTDDDNALPVELVSFNGSCNDGVVDLIWQTASENNSEDFEVAYSRDGIDWDLIHTEPAAGFSTELISYTYEHTQAISGDNYYRLTQNDIDGASVIYENLIINASCQSTANGYFSIFPNPSSGSFQVVMNNPEIEGAANLNITDTKGNRVFTKKIVVNSGINMYVIQQELAPGIYYINVENGARTTTVVKHSIR